MNFANWIDSFIDTFEKRWICISIAILLFWLWQTVWVMLFFVQLSKVNDYLSLFQFMNNMDSFTSSFIVRILLSFVSTNGSFIDALQKVTFVEVIMIFLTWIQFKSIFPKYRCYLVGGYYLYD